MALCKIFERIERMMGADISAQIATGGWICTGSGVRDVQQVSIEQRCVNYIS